MPAAPVAATTPCVVCAGPRTSANRGPTCSRRCGSRLREQRKAVEWRKPRTYPAELIAAVQDMYLNKGMTVAEVQAALPPGYKAQRIIERHVPVRRPAAKRHQSGTANHMWKGDDAGYSALHLRVYAARGRPTACSRCGTTDSDLEWANLTGHYEDINDYDPHVRRLPLPVRRRPTSRNRAAYVAREEVMPHVLD